MADFSDIIKQAGNVRSAQISESFKPLQQAFRYGMAQDERRFQEARSQIEEINKIKDELGMMNGELVENEVNSLVSDIRDNIVKEQKMGNFSFGKKIDLSALRQYQKRISEVGRMAKNSILTDKIWADAKDQLEANKFVPEGAKAEIQRQITRMVSDPEILRSFNPQDLILQTSNLIDKGVDPNRVAADIIGKIGDKTTNITENGQTISVSHSNLLQVDEKTGQASLSPEGRAELERVYNEQIPEVYRSNKPFDEYLRQWENSLSSKYLRDNTAAFQAKEAMKRTQAQIDAKGKGKPEDDPRNKFVDLASSYLFRRDIFDDVKAGDLTKGLLNAGGVYEYRGKDDKGSFVVLSKRKPKAGDSSQLIPTQEDGDSSEKMYMEDMDNLYVAKKWLQDNYSVSDEKRADVNEGVNDVVGRLSTYPETSSYMRSSPVLEDGQVTGGSIPYFAPLSRLGTMNRIMSGWDFSGYTSPNQQSQQPTGKFSKYNK